MNWYAVRHGTARALFTSLDDVRAFCASLPGSVEHTRFRSLEEATISLADPPPIHVPEHIIARRLKSEKKKKPIVRAVVELAPPQPMGTRPGELVVFCDGSVLRARGGAGVWFGVGDARNRAIAMDTAVFPTPTSTIAEIHAATCALAIAIESHPGPVGIVTDCAAVIDLMRRRCFPKKGALRTLALRLWHLVEQHGGTARIAFYKVKGHSGVMGNVMADKLARRGAMGFEDSE